MKKAVLFILSMLLLTACSGQPARATQPPADVAYVAPDTSLATPAFGYARIAKVSGVQSVLLRSKPDSKAPLTGQVFPGDEARVLGLDSTGEWVLLQFDGKTGWALYQVLDITIAQ